MIRRVVYLTAIAGLGALLTGCAFNFLGFEQRAAWRGEEENACLAERPPVLASAYVVKARGIDGHGTCGISHPLKVSALEDGSVRIGPTATLGCPMTAFLERWLQESVQPAAIAWFGMPIVEIHQISAYSCRTRNNVRGAKLSEHAFGNALDIAGFTLANGRKITIKAGWHGAEDEQGFLREIEATACARFKTVLGPGAAYHSDHFHLDLAHHNKDGTSRYCHPKPLVSPPPRQPYRGGRFAATPVPGGFPPHLPGLPRPPSPSGFFAHLFGWNKTPTPPADVPMSYAQ